MCLGWDGEGEILTPTCRSFAAASSPLEGEEKGGREKDCVSAFCLVLRGNKKLLPLSGEEKRDTRGKVFILWFPKVPSD